MLSREHGIILPPPLLDQSKNVAVESKKAKLPDMGGSMTTTEYTAQVQKNL